MKKKACKKCKRELPATEEFFYKRNDSRDGFHSECISCYIKRVQNYAENNKDKVKEYDKKRHKKSYYENNKKNYIKISNLHSFIRKIKPKQKYCTICNEPQKLQLANISGKYLRTINDYIWLCQPCHSLFDKIRNTHGGIIR